MRLQHIENDSFAATMHYQQRATVSLPTARLPDYAAIKQRQAASRVSLRSAPQAAARSTALYTDATLAF